jgi:DNA-binding FadR family transcriptional regulator
MVQSRKITRDRLADVQATLLDWIRTARFASGEKIPTERELSRVLSQPRHVVRAAILELASRGLLVRHVGRGTHVASANGPSFEKPVTITAPNGDEVTLASILEARLLFEPALARLAAARASGADLERLDHCVRAIEGAQTMAELESAEAGITVVIAEVADNPLLTGMTRLLAASWSSHAKTRGDRIAASIDRRDAIRGAALELIAALRALDADRAAEICRSYIVARLRQFSGFALTETPRPMESIIGKENSTT